MKKNALFLVLATGISICQVKAQRPMPLLRSFMRDVANPNVEESIIINKYLCNDFNGMTKEKKDKASLFAKNQIFLLRNYMKKDSIDSGNFVFYNYEDRPEKDKNTLMIEQTGVIYACYYKDKFFNYFLINNSKIESFATANKSGNLVFIYNCQ